MSRLPLGFILCTLAGSVVACASHQQSSTPSLTVEPLPPSQHPWMQQADLSPSEQSPGADSRTLIIHPLTRVGTDAAGRPAILLHLEFHDKFNQDVKAFGIARVALQGPDRDGSREWQVDLREPRNNALTYDGLVTRTYTIPLGGIPNWLILWSQDEIKTTNASSFQPELRVWFTLEPPPGAKPGEDGRTLRASRKLTH